MMQSTPEAFGASSSESGQQVRTFAISTCRIHSKAKTCKAQPVLNVITVRISTKSKDKTFYEVGFY